MALRPTAYPLHPETAELHNRRKQPRAARRLYRQLAPKIAYLAVTALALNAQPVLAQDLLCIPPATPILPSDLDTLRAYRSELSQEFDDYFRLAGEYLTCLNAAASATRSDVERAIVDYEELLNITLE